MTTKICTAAGTLAQACDTCRHNIEHHPEFEGLAHAQPGEFEMMEPDICKFPMGPQRQYWTQYESLKQDA